MEIKIGLKRLITIAAAFTATALVAEYGLVKLYTKRIEEKIKGNTNNYIG